MSGAAARGGGAARRAGAALAALLLAAPLAAGAASGALVGDGRYAMGTILEITLEPPGGSDGRALLDRAYARAEALERLLTSFDEDSALMRFNRAAGAGPRPVPPDLARVLAESVALGRATGGAFDVTVGPLVRLWQQAAAQGRRPTPEALAAARARVGADGIRVDLEAGTAALARPGMAVELGGIAKGYALDRIGEELRAAGVTRALLSFGQSSLLALGAPPGADGWRLLVRRPDGGFVGVATLRDQAASVSQTLGQFTEIEGRRYGHLVDPRSGEPLVRNALAMVLAASATEAEAWSKALLVLEPEAALARLEARPGVEALLLEADGRRFETSGWRAASRLEPLPDPREDDAP